MRLIGQAVGVGEIRAGTAQFERPFVHAPGKGRDGPAHRDSQSHGGVVGGNQKAGVQGLLNRDYLAFDQAQARVIVGNRFDHLARDRDRVGQGQVFKR